MSSSGKITTISCQIDFSLISLILAITRSRLLMYANAHVPFTTLFMYVITKEEKSQSVTQ